MNSFLNLPRGDIYNYIQIYPLALSERDVAQALDKSRFDPRLMEIMAEFIRDFWWRLNSMQLNKVLKKSKSPYVIKGITSVILDLCEMKQPDRVKFSQWVYFCTRGIKDPRPQLLYIGVIPFGKSLLLETTEAVPAFLKHQLITKDLPFNKAKPCHLKTSENPSKNRVTEVDLLKFRYCEKIKTAKYIKKLSNKVVCEITGINRVFLSKILNNKLDGISVEYLQEKASRLDLLCGEQVS